VIFDSPQAERLITKYANRPRWDRPYSYVFASLPEFAAERQYLDATISSAPPEPAAKWARGILSPHDGTFLASWFETMLYGWLLPVGTVQVEPQFRSGRPDFAVVAGNQRVFIEAHAHLRSPSERREDKFVAQIFTIISSLKFPFMIEIDYIEVAGQLSAEAFETEVITWLSSNPTSVLLFKDSAGNRVNMQASPSPSNKPQTYAMRISDASSDPSSLRRPLKRKAAKYPEVRHNFPYVIALYHESGSYSARDVAAAWFGNEQIIIDTHQNQIVEARVDRTGLHFFLEEIRHRSVSGTLVFSPEYSTELGRRQLRGSFIENPYANIQVDLTLFPIPHSLVVVARSENSIAMEWK